MIAFDVSRTRKTRRSKRRQRNGLAALEVVILTGGIFPALLGLLWLGFKAMAAFVSLVGTMIGSSFM